MPSSAARAAAGPSDLVLIVDAAADNLAVLRDALDESGYSVLVATRGEAALAHAQQARPDIVLLDALLPDIDGFEVARRLKADAATAHIPIVFMTGRTETEHLVAALDAGGVDCVTKPIKLVEMLARMNVHLQGARRARQQAHQAGQARNALDAFGFASIMVGLPEGRLIWQTALARELLLRYCGTQAPETPAAVYDWLRQHIAAARRQIEPPVLSIAQGSRRLSLRLHQQTDDSDEEGVDDGGDWLIILREVFDSVLDSGVIDAMRVSLKLTAREAEVLYWVVKGKTNRDIGEILGSSPATAKKHLERVYVKLGVETRTAAAGVAIKRIPELRPQCEL